MINHGYGYEYAANIFDNHNQYMNINDDDENEGPETHVIAEKLLQKAVNIVFPQNENNEKSNYNKPKAPLRDFGLEILSSVSLQVCLYMSICFYAILLVGLGYSTFFKFKNFYLNGFYSFLLIFFFFTLAISEPFRIYFGYMGNLKENVPAITGCILFSIYHAICALFYSAGQFLIPKCLRLPIDVAIGVLHFLIVFIECILCYNFGSKVIKYRSAWFVLLIKNENDKDEFSDPEDDDNPYDNSTQKLLRAYNS
ncbi:hypothetical protein BCR32DRAFT_264134 [Anaeromyces robustus]|uniref:Uncharacterized protein n=1 Tax=Anaeromyces robustus TaxID=1754192 RepID=A0A1Y1XPX5_9FUNG|nr:hypothetical protein BCR32DRAFT_264134 [Anaeromyces robustus]|eukprot:ORX87715.1 hypothetical protein BCR32DRAFT_264134 [Anaeromyces robustus]